MSNVSLRYNNHREIDVEFFSFPGGERHVKIKSDFTEARSLRLCVHNHFRIYANLKTPGDFFDVALLADAVRRIPGYRDVGVALDLSCPYIPYARQDRACVAGEPHSIKVFAGLLNSLKFNNIYTLDPHSDVTPALIDNLVVMEQHEVWRNNYEGKVLVAPDAGALKKIYKFNHPHVACLNKKRDVTNGAILGTEIASGDVAGKDCVIIDDICDGGRTFIESAKVLRAAGAKRVELQVTHGIFSKGLKPLLEGGIDFISTANLFPDISTLEGKENLSVISVLP